LIGPQPGGDPRYLGSLGLMYEDALPFLGARSAQDALLSVGSHLNPIPKAAVEAMTGKSLFQRGPNGPVDIADQDPLLGRTLANLAGRQEAVPTPALLEQAIANSPLSRVLSTARTATDSRKSATAKLFNLGTGLKFTDVPERQRDRILGELANQAMERAGAKSFEHVSFSEQQRAQMTPEQLQAARQFMALQSLLTKRAKQRKQEQQRAAR
jgi:hypothetical protein